jgi:Protein of unknown function (DUF1194)
MRRLLWLAALLLGAVPAAAAPVDLELVLAVDISGSIDLEEAQLQRDGYVEAFVHPQVIEAITSGFHGRIAVAYFEWASAWDQRPVMGWRLIDGAESAREAAAIIAAAPIQIGQRTSIASAIEYALPMFGRSGYEAERRVIDISGDGPNNDGAPIWVARDRAAAMGVVINGLPIVNDRPNRWGFPKMPDLDLYYEGCVITGPGAFVVIAEDFSRFGEAVRRKLLLEIAGAAPAPRLVPARALLARYEPGCDAGERQSREYFQRRWGGHD